MRDAVITKAVSPETKMFVEGLEASGLTDEDLAMLYRMSYLGKDLGFTVEQLVASWIARREEAMLTKQTIANYKNGTEPQVSRWRVLMTILLATLKLQGKEVDLPEGFHFLVPLEGGKGAPIQTKGTLGRYTGSPTRKSARPPNREARRVA